MNSSKLVTVFYALSAYERNQLQKWVHSPFHNQHEKVTALFDYLYLGSAKDTERLRKSVIFPVLFPGAVYNDQKMRHVCSYLQELIEDFLVWKELEQDSRQRDMYLLRAYRSRNIDKAFDTGWNAVSKAFRNAEVRDLNYHYSLYQLYVEKYNNTDARGIEIHSVLQELNDELDIYFIINKLKQACNMLSHQRMFKTSYQLTLLDEIVTYIEQHALDKIPEVGIYYSAYMVLSQEDEAHFTRLKEQIGQYHRTFRPEEMRDLYLLAINYCITRLNKGEAHYTREVFEIYRTGIDNRVLFENEMLSPFTFKNIAAVGLKLNEMAWTENFIETCYTAIPKPYRESFYIYNKAKLAFTRTDYRQVVKALHNLEIQDLFTHMDAKVLLAKTYFELERYEMLDYLLDNMGQLLRRKKMMAYHQKNYSNFISFIRRMINLREYDPVKRDKLAAEISTATILTEREWLLEKMEKN